MQQEQDIGKPYIDEIRADHIIRAFDKQVKEEQLIWHKDKKDRYILAVSGEGWKLQIDNQLPVELKSDKIYPIPKETYHRLVKGNGDLILKIKEI